MEKKYWKGLEELQHDAEFVRSMQNEFAEPLPIEALGGKSANEAAGANPNRRDFLKFLGFGVAAATLASCEAPVKKTIPYLIKPEEVTPGIANWYASTYFDGYDYSSILVKTREGRPIKIEGNPNSSVSKGGVNGRVHASVLSLYDSTRLKAPLNGKKTDTWASIDSAIGNKLNEVVAKGKAIRVVTPTIISPSMKAALAAFSAKYANTQVVTYDVISSSAKILANEASFGIKALPTYAFANAQVIVSVGEDFLADMGYAKDYIANRKLNGKKGMSRHYQVESRLSLTGSNADKRIQVLPSQQSKALVYLYNAVAKHLGAAQLASVSLDKKVSEVLDKAAADLAAAKGKALVLAGQNDFNSQLVANDLNTLLASYGSTIDLNNTDNTRQGVDSELAAFLAEVKAGTVGAVFFLNSNPVYTLPGDFKADLAKVDLKVSFADREDETAAACDFVTPDSHFLESWTDAQPRPNVFSVGQPTIAPLFKTRQALESFLLWSGNTSDAHTFIQQVWNTGLYAKASNGMSFEAFWNKALQDGNVELAPAAMSANASKISAAAAGTAIANEKASGLEVELYVKAGMGIGNQSNNPWLQEMPDPISKVCWDNYFAVSPRFAKEKNLEQGSVITVEVNGTKLEGPVFVQPGQVYGAIAVAVGYGRTMAGKAGNGVGFNTYTATKLVNNQMNYMGAGANLSTTSKELYTLAATQTHHTMMGRAIVKETSLEKYVKDPRSGNPEILITTTFGEKKPAKDVDFWKSFDRPNHQWALAIDLNSCIGCGACVVSCQAENNVPVVGKDEIGRSREMHWIRIDRYYSSDAEEGDTRAMEVPSEDPQVVFQPVMCQHCNHAPCETVCPVAATTHSSEGLNMMAYNRCVGTRYCANNCPYKVRRFNWFKYSDNKQFDFNMNDDLGKMVLNPDVTVRSRGVMEKCTMCVQRIQEVKLTSKKESRRPMDGEIQTACTQSCPTNALIFGDLNDANSNVAKMLKDDRSYHLLEELNVQPSVFYQTKVRNS